jgi:hypothetical protein
MFPVFDQDDIAALFIEAVLFSFLFFMCVSNIHRSLSISVARSFSLYTNTHTHRVLFFLQEEQRQTLLFSA